MKSPNWRLWLAILLFIAALALLLAASLPAARLLQEVPIPPLTAPTPVSMVMALGGC